MSATVVQPRLRIAFAGAFAVRLEERVRALLDTPCDVIRADGEVALYRALAQRTIAGAALDVWYQSPTGPGPTWPARQAFQDLSNVLMTPHMSGWTEGMLKARAQGIAENIQRVGRGEPPVHLIPTSMA